MTEDLHYVPFIICVQIDGSKKERLYPKGQTFYPSREEAFEVLLEMVGKIETLCPEGYRPESCLVLLTWRESFRPGGGATQWATSSLPEERLRSFLDH